MTETAKGRDGGQDATWQRWRPAVLVYLVDLKLHGSPVAVSAAVRVNEIPARSERRLVLETQDKVVNVGRVLVLKPLLDLLHRLVGGCVLQEMPHPPRPQKCVCVSNHIASDCGAVSRAE